MLYNKFIVDDLMSTNKDPNYECVIIIESEN